MSDATLTLFRSVYLKAPATTRKDTAASIRDIVARFVHNKDASELTPGEITVQMNDAGLGSLSDYLSELRITIDQQDYPFDFDRDSFDPVAAQATCTEMARLIWYELEFMLSGPFLVWVLAGLASGYYDTFTLRAGNV